jgi:TolB-like protein/Tfp pilus assembly protein PilF
LKKLIHEAHRRSLWQVVGIYLIGSWIGYQVIQGLTEGLGLPEWFPGMAVVLFIIGLPIVIATAFIQEGTGSADHSTTTGSGDASPAHQPGPAQGVADGNGSIFTWRNAIFGGMAAFALWGVVAAGWILFGPGRSTAAEDTAATIALSADAEDGPQMDLRSVAVLPFSTVASDEQSLAFVAGIHDDVLTQLSKIDSLTVISRTSVMQYRETEQTIPEIADELGVAAVLEGGVQRSADRIRVNVQLIEAATDRHLWAETYDAELTAENVFAIQSDMAREIAGALEATLAPGVGARIDAGGTGSLEAYDLYAKGLYTAENHGSSRDGLERAAEYYRQALAIDSTFAAAWARLGFTQGRLQNDGYLTPSEARELMHDYSARALSLDPNLAEGYMVRSSVAYLDLDLEAAEADLLTAIEMEPGLAEAHRLYGGILASLERSQEAIASYRRAVQLDPLAIRSRMNLAVGLYRLERDEDAALKELLYILEIEPANEDALYWAGSAFVTSGRAEEGIKMLERARDIDPDDPYVHSIVGWAYARVGRVEEARESVALVPEEGGDLLKEIALVYGELGEQDRAFEYLDRAFETDPSSILRLGTDMMADSLRADPRFEPLMERVGL